MNFKIFEIDGVEICIHRDLTDDGQAVRVTAFLNDSENEEYVQESIVNYPDADMAISAIEDFSEASARRWLEGQRALLA